MALIAYPSLSNTSHLSTGTNYSYVHVKPQGNNLYILFLHGFPDTSFVWRRQIDYFAKKGYGLVVPDLLGYGGTDKPKKLEAYRLKKMAGEVVEILDLLGVQTVIGVGHDWYFIPVIKVAAFGAYQSVVTKGSNFLSRLANYHSNRFTKLVWLDVAYKAPTGEIFSPEAINEATEKPLGYPIFGYWLFFRDDDAGRIIDEHRKSIVTLKFAKDPIFMKNTMCPIGACRSYFEKAPATCAIADWVDEGEIEIYEKIMNEGGYAATLNWYKAQMANLNTPDEAEIVEEDKQDKVPALLVTCAHDGIAVPAMQAAQMPPYCKYLTVKALESGHFCQQEKVAEVNHLLEEFIQRKP